MILTTWQETEVQSNQNKEADSDYNEAIAVRNETVITAYRSKNNILRLQSYSSEKEEANKGQ